MPRPRHGRRIEHRLNSTFFKPAGIPARQLRVTTIELDELEAMRLVDGEELKQVDAAEKMEISQSTIARLLASGRKKCALALAHSEALDLKKGNAPLNFNPSTPCRHQRRGEK